MVNLEALNAKQLGTGFPGDGVISYLEKHRVFRPSCSCLLAAGHRMLLIGKVDGDA